MPSVINEPRILLDGLTYVESPGWHDGRLWFCHWAAGEIVAVDIIITVSAGQAGKQA